MAGAAFASHAAAPKEAGAAREAAPLGRSVKVAFVLGNEVRAVESGTAPYGLRGLTPEGLEVCPAAVYATLSGALGAGLGGRARCLLRTRSENGDEGLGRPARDPSVRSV